MEIFAISYGHEIYLDLDWSKYWLLTSKNHLSNSSNLFLLGKMLLGGKSNRIKRSKYEEIPCFKSLYLKIKWMDRIAPGGGKLNGILARTWMPNRLKGVFLYYLK